MAKKGGKSKLDFKQLFLEKGERIGVIVAGAFLVLMIGLGVVAALSSKPSDTIAGNLKTSAQQIETRVRTGEGTPNPLPEWTKGDFREKAVPLNEFVAKYPLFDPIDRQESKRTNPRIFGVTEFQADLVRAQIRIYDVIAKENGEVLVGVIRDKTATSAKIIDGLRKNTRKTGKQLGQVQGSGYTVPGMGGPGGAPFGPGGMGGPGGIPGGPGGPAAIPGGGPGGPGGPGGLSAPGGLVGPGGLQGSSDSAGPAGESPGGMIGPGYNPNAQRKGIEQVLEYVDLDKSKDLSGMRLAEKIMPRRMIQVAASFPYKLQVEEFRRALRYQSAAELFADPTGPPTFTGFEVKRQIRNLEGDKVIQPWTTLDVLGNYQRINIRRVGVQPEDPKLAPVIMPLPNKAVLPNPLLARGTFPEIKLEPIQRTLKELTDAYKMKTVPNAWKQKFSGGDDPFNPYGVDTTTSAQAGGFFGQPTGESAPGAAESPEGSVDPSQPQKPWEPQESILVRFLDVDVIPGYTYEYQIRLKTANPNEGKPTLVSQQSMAKEKELFGDWIMMRPEDAVRVPPEAHLYAVGYDEKERPKNADTTKLQIQSWMEAVKLNNVAEPVGAWVVSKEMESARGEYVGRRMLTRLPLWSAEYKQYVMRDPKGQLLKDPKKQRDVGVDVDFATRTLLVDFEGGRTEYTLANNKKKDDSAAEMLLMTEDGKLLVRSSGNDRNDTDREARQKEWDEWVKSVENAKLMQGGTPTTPAGTPNPFTPGSPASSSGGTRGGS